MSTRVKLWLFPALLYAVFVFWYTDFGGPLSDEEVDEFVSVMTANGVPPERVDYFAQFLRADTGRQFLMVNNLDMNQNPPAVEGAPAGADADTLMGLYMEHMIPELLKRACHPVIMGPAVYTAIDISGIEGAGQWTDAALFRYRSRRSAKLPGPDSALAGVLGRARLCHCAALRHAHGRRHLSSRYVSARRRARAVERGLCATQSPPHRWPLR